MNRAILSGVVILAAVALASCGSPGPTASAPRPTTTSPSPGERLSAVCTKYRNTVNHDLQTVRHHLDDWPDTLVAARLTDVELGLRTFALAVAHLQVSGTTKMVNDLQAAARDADTSANEWDSGNYGAANLSGIYDNAIKALDDATPLNAEGCLVSTS